MVANEFNNEILVDNQKPLPCTTPNSIQNQDDTTFD